MPFQRVFLVVVFVLGVAIRFYIQFLDPRINGDEVFLGLNIMERGLPELLQPLNNFQSAPPLYLLTLKFFFGLLKPFWVSAKLLSFLVSLMVLGAAARLGPRLFRREETQGVFLLFFALSPFILYNTLTIK